MAIFIGLRPDAAFTRVPNDWARDPKLSFKAKGLLTYLLSHQDGYRLTVEQVVAEATDGKSAVYSAIKELVEHGYLERVQRRGERGKVGEVDYYVADAPVTTASGFTASGKPESGDDQEEQEEAAGGTASRFSASGLSACGESTTKKTRDKKTKVLEDQNTISLSAREGATHPGASVIAAEEPERETRQDSFQPTETSVERRLIAKRQVAGDEIDFVREWIDSANMIDGPGWWIVADRNGTLDLHIAAAREAYRQRPTTAVKLSTEPCPAHPWQPRGRPCQACAGERNGREPPAVLPTRSSGNHRRILSPADQRVLDAAPLYAKYKARETGHKPYLNPAPEDFHRVHDPSNL